MGHALRADGTVILAAPVADELPAAVPVADPVADGYHRTPSGLVRPGNVLASRPRHKAGKCGSLAKLEVTADPDWQAAHRWGRAAASDRVKFLAKLHGGECSSGVCCLVADSWEMRADAKWIRAMGAQPDGDLTLLDRAAALEARAKANDLASWELAAREAAGRAKMRELAGDDDDWLVGDTPPQADPDPEIALVRKRGRPRKARTVRDRQAGKGKSRDGLG